MISRHQELGRTLHKCCLSVETVEYFLQFLCKVADFLKPEISYFNLLILYYNVLMLVRFSI